MSPFIDPNTTPNMTPSMTPSMTPRSSAIHALGSSLISNDQKLQISSKMDDI